MNEWNRLLKQTHPEFKNIEVIESYQTGSDPESPQAIEGEIEWISSTQTLQSKIKNIPDKFGFKIGEAAEYVGVKQYVLRYWESEFDLLKPKKSKNGQRMYTKKNVETALLIKKLLHEDRFSIEGAQGALRKLRKQVKEKQEGIELKNSGSQEVPGHQGSVDFAKKLLSSIRQAQMELSF